MHHKNKEHTKESNMKYFKTIYLLLCCTLAWGACSNEDTTDLFDLSITAPTSTNVSYNAVTLSAILAGSGYSSILKKGFCYSTESNPDIYQTTVELRSNDLTGTLNGLSQNTTYHVKAFVTLYNAEPVYSPEITFTTLNESDEDLLAQYEAPTYIDNYTSLSDWSQRNQWNLANVHDPSIMKAEDGYYYMYQTDASYGNAHTGHGHFHARRSKDLVNWEYMGATMNETAPSWIKEKLNATRVSLRQ